MLKKLPHDPEAERNLIGACFNSQHAFDEVMATVKRVWFEDSTKLMIYDALRSFSKSKYTPSIGDVASELQKQNQLDAVGGAAALRQLQMGAVGIHVRYYVDRLFEVYRRRELLLLSTEISKSHESGKVASEIIADIHAKLCDITRAEHVLPIKTVGQILGTPEEYDKHLTTAREQSARGGFVLQGPTTGFEAFDRHLLGLVPKDLVFVGARPKTGKSELLCQMMAKGAVKGVRSIFVSLEMSEHKLATRLVGILASVAPHRIHSGRLTEQEQQRVAYAYKEMLKYQKNCLILDAGRIDLETLRYKAQQCIASDGLDVIYVDYVQKMTHPNHNATLYQQVTDNSQGLKQLAKELNVCIVSAAQMSRDYKDLDAQPRMSQMKDSGALEQDADVVILPWRKDYDDKTREPGIVRFVIDKCRDRETGILVFRYDKDTADLHETFETVQDELKNGNSDFKQFTVQ